MASTYSPTLRIELIGDGDQSGIWGQTTNNNLGALIEQAITGVATILMVDANYVLTSYNGVLDEARNAVIVATGTNSAQRDIIAPLVEKTYTIKNNTTGGYAVRIIGTSGSGIVIPNGVTASVFCDGSNFYNLQVGTTGNEVINGNLTVTGTATIGGLLSGSTATFSGAISSVSPSFTGVPTAPTAASGTSTTQIATTAFVASSITGLGLGTMSTQNANNVAITGGNINGTAIGGTTRSTGAFTTLTLSSALAVAYGGTGTTTSTGSGNVVLSSSPTLNTPSLVAPVLGTPTAGTLTNCIGLPLTTGVTGTLPVLNGGTGTTTSTGTGSTVLSASPALSGVPTAPTAANGTNTTQIATTQFVGTAITNLALGTMSTQNANNVNITGGTIGASVSWAAMPAGTRVMFAQASAPTGWTQVTDDSANNRMLRVVNSTGAGTGGTASPILMDVVPSHTHTYTTGTESATHTHTGTTGTESANHTHGFSATTSTNGNHTHSVWYNSFGVSSGSTTALGSNSLSQYFTGYVNIPYGGDHNHSVSGTTGGISANHTHNFTSATESATHTHSGTTATNASSSNWAPRYIDMILCAKA